MVDVNAMRKTYMVPEIKPLDQYDFTRAKICASLAWLLAKSYGAAERVPEELREPFYSDQYEQEHVKPPVTRLLLSSELYCRVCGLILRGEGGGEGGGAPRDNAALLQLLTRRGLQPTEQDQPITEADLRLQPIKMSAHLAVIDALMSAFAMETMSSVKISVGGVDSDSGSAPSKLQPVPWEYAILFWVNKLIHKLQEGTEREQTHRHLPGTDLQTQPSCPTRWYWKLVPIRYRKDKMMTKQTPTFPAVTGVKDLSNGCAIAAAVHHYCPDILHLEDVCLKETMSVADSLYNLQLIQEFCQECLGSCCPLALEDLLYTPPVLKVNIMTFMAELFWWFEIRKPEFVNPKEPLDLEDVSGMNECTSPTSGNSNSGSPAFIFRQPFLTLASPQSPSRSSPGSLNQSTSMPHVEGIGRTWTKKQRRPLSQEVSFSIPFGLDSDVEVVMGNPVLSSSSLVRSVSSDSLNPSVFQAPQTVTHATYTPPDDVDGFLRKHPAGKNGPLGPQRATWSTQTPATLGKMKAEREGLENGLPDDLPTIEEAMQIIHNEGTLEPRLHPEGAPDEFYLHSPYILEDSRGRLDGSPSRMSCSAPSRSGMMHRVPGEVAAAGLGFPSERGWRQRRTSEGSRISRDDDSVLRDNSLDSDEEFPKQQQQPKQDVRDGKDDCPSGLSSQPDSSNSNQDSSTSTGVRMTSFAERKKKLSTSETPKDPAEPQMVTSAQKCEESPGKSPALNTEMSQLGARLEEKRRAIEAQKKRIEAIFAKHRQRLGKSAFLQLKREGGGGGSDLEGEEETPKLSLEERLSRIEDEEELDTPSPLGTVETPDSKPWEPKSHPEKQVTFSPEIGKEKLEDEAHLGEYNKAVSKLNAALSSLQSDMQRLSDQQKQLMHKKPATKAWVIPASPKPTAATPPLPSSSQRLSRDFQLKRSTDLSSSSPSPSPSRKPPSSSSTPLTPKSPQPAYKRPQSAPPKSPKHSRPLDLKFPPLTRVMTPPNNVDTLPHLRKFSSSQCTVQTSSSFNIGGERASRAPVVEDDSSETGSSEDQLFSLEMEGNARPWGRKEQDGGSSSGAPSECSFESDPQPPAPTLNGKRSSLIEIALSSLRAPEEEEEGEENGCDSTNEQRGGVGFFFKDEARPEDEMAQRRAALLEKQQKRAEEVKRRKQWQELDSKPAGEVGEVKEEKPEQPSRPVEKGARRGDFTRQEYERRHQLKIMEDLDKVLRQKPTTVRGVKKQRPKTVFRDDSVLSRSPVKGYLGSRLSKVYSHSTLSLSTMASDTGKKSPRAQSPSGLKSPSRLLSNQNGEDWENTSTASSPASIPEYTGPKLYKEPSLKSNKFIIHNALSRCCLAGRVNEAQKNKILEEMEKSKANHFLILFRDASCQFRAVYSMNPETEEMQRVAGIGPRVISLGMVEGIFKYSSDRKQFTPIPSKTMSMSVDAVTIQGHLWQSKRPGTPKKPGTPK
ncbi:calmodulin-regulated spectrin-associated protein 3-like isoform X2 [Acipenser ruthenus]|uniref:calmodulin-regulated spectrin-associated protein 3-like isoform X2 n=1 Tax=Acipenser ruthenus TaxID=7906 RepID=UPI002741A121|nr:calmodulin-regulated spectrin-associated protein 3-like isoform X2 [Acipenser ruthenus]